MELITSESETILPLFLSYSVLSSSLLFGIQIYKTFYWSGVSKTQTSKTQTSDPKNSIKVGNVTLHIYRGDLHIGVNWNTIHALNSPAVTQIKS